MYEANELFSELDGRFVGASETLLIQLISVALHKFFNTHTSKPRVIVDVGANIGIIGIKLFI